jgi:hypothetical protein
MAETSPAAASFAHKRARSEYSEEGAPGEPRAMEPPPEKVPVDPPSPVIHLSCSGRRAAVGVPPRGSTVQLRGPATWPIRAKTPPPLVSVRRHVGCGVEVKGSSSIRR